MMEETKEKQKVKSKMGKPGKSTSNPFLNFLRQFRKQQAIIEERGRHSGKYMRSMAAHIWKNFDEEDRKRYVNEARMTRDLNKRLVKSRKSMGLLVMRRGKIWKGKKVLKKQRDEPVKTDKSGKRRSGKKKFGKRRMGKVWFGKDKFGKGKSRKGKFGKKKKREASKDSKGVRFM